MLPLGQRELCRFSRDEQGAAAIEFAFIAPILFGLYVGAVDFGQALSIDRRVKTIAASVSDILARQVSVDLCDLDKSVSISNHLLATAKAIGTRIDDLEIEMLSLRSDADKNVTLEWGYKFDDASLSPRAGCSGLDAAEFRGSTADYTTGDAYTDIDKDVIGADQGMIVVNVTYTFEPFFFKALNNITGNVKLCNGAQDEDTDCTLTLQDRAVNRPRSTSVVLCDDC